MGMGRLDTSRTHPSLLIRVRDTADQHAWDEFHERYAPMIRGWCRLWFPHETDDMVQEVFLKLSNCLKAFEYQPGKGRFRGYLKTVTHRLMAELKGKWDPPLPQIDETMLDQVKARKDLEQRLAAEYDLELLAEAKQHVRRRVTDRTWLAYVETAERGREPAEVARELGMGVGAVYQARYSIITALSREIQDLLGPLEKR
jgi:RNA polymerase sigma-70 factor (ECF subfamily)